MSNAKLDQVLKNITKPNKIISKEVRPLTFGNGNFFIAILSHVVVKIDENGSEKTLHLMTKSANPSPLCGNGALSMDRVFYNEVTFYQQFASLFQGRIPAFYFGELAEKGGIHYLLIEYLNDYKMHPEIRFLPDDHVMYACWELGVFHGTGYIAKSQDDMFEAKCLGFKETRYEKESMDDGIYEAFFKLCGFQSRRAFKYLPNREGYGKGVLEKYEKLTQDVGSFTTELIKPKNNLAVLCHGDYNRNNIMFHYESDKIKSMKIIDFQTVRYSQPTTDLSTLLLMNLKAEDLEQNYEKCLKIYHQALVETIQPKLSLEGFELERFLEDYAKHCWIGYLIIIFFHAVLDDPSKVGDPDFLLRKMWTDEELENRFKDFGTEETFENVGKVLKYCIDLNEKFLNK